MRLYALVFLGLLAAAATGVARGADVSPPAPLPPQTAPEQAAGCCEVCSHGCPCHGCGRACCVPEPTKKKTEKVVYDCKCVEFCVPKCPGLRICHEKDCKGCEIPLEPKCGRVRVKKVLIKKVETTECEACRCVPPGQAGK